MKTGDKVKLVRVHRFHHHSLHVYFEQNKVGEVRGVNLNGTISVRFGTALVSFDVKPEYLELIK